MAEPPHYEHASEPSYGPNWTLTNTDPIPPPPDQAGRWHIPATLQTHQAPPAQGQGQATPSALAVSVTYQNIN